VGEKGIGEEAMEIHVVELRNGTIFVVAKK